MTHKCPIKGCAMRVAATKLMCAYHWRMVPAAPARELYAAYDDDPGSARHRAAMEAATKAVEDKLSGGKE
jgi:hypothetical protein